TMQGIGMADAYSRLSGAKNDDLLGQGKSLQGIMEFSRAYGLSPDAVAGQFGAGARAGGFKPGDARRFADMLFSAQNGGGAISSSRIEELLGATTDLISQLSSVVPTIGEAETSKLIAFQTMLGQTNLSPLQGAGGARVISSLNQGMAGGNENVRAVLLRGLMKQGMNPLDAMTELEKGVAGKGFPALLKMIKNMSGGNELLAAEFLHSNFGLSYGQSSALIREGVIDDPDLISSFDNSVKSGKGIGAKAAKAMGTRGGKLQVSEATMSKANLRLGESLFDGIVQASSDIAKSLDSAAGRLEKAIDTVASKLGEWAGDVGRDVIDALVNSLTGEGNSVPFGPGKLSQSILGMNMPLLGVAGLNWLPALSKGQLPGAPRDGGKRVHQGIDVPGPPGTPVSSRMAGYVKEIHDRHGWGVDSKGKPLSAVIIMGDNGIEGTYGHVNLPRGMKVGSRVEANSIVGSIGKDHVHEEFWDNPNPRKTRQGKNVTLQYYYSLRDKAKKQSMLLPDAATGDSTDAGGKLAQLNVNIQVDGTTDALSPELVAQMRGMVAEAIRHGLPGMNIGMQPVVVGKRG
nr:peptidoglycan DD-metalloendopeptidase family protein [Candidatus Omnitrophota bacterium]